MVFFIGPLFFAANLLLLLGIYENVSTMMWLGICSYLILPTIILLSSGKANSIVLDPYSALEEFVTYEVVKKVEVDGVPMCFVRKEGDDEGVLRVFAEWQNERAPQRFCFTKGSNGPVGSFPAGFYEVE